MIAAARRCRCATRTVLRALIALGLTAGLATPAAAGVTFEDIIVSQSSVTGAKLGAGMDRQVTAAGSKLGVGTDGGTLAAGRTDDAAIDAVQKVREAANRAAAPAQP